jgi:hypothetical protein
MSWLSTIWCWLFHGKYHVEYTDGRGLWIECKLGARRGCLPLERNW